MSVSSTHRNGSGIGLLSFLCYASIFLKCPLHLLISSLRLLLRCRTPFGIRRLSPHIVLVTHLLSGLAGSRTSAAETQISVLYAGSLGNLIEKDLGPAFSHATGYKYLGEAKGSLL